MAGMVSESTRPQTFPSMKLSRRFIAAVVLACLLLGLIAANLIYARESGRGQLLAGNPGELLYVSAFSGFLDEWELYDGQQSARVREETLELRVGAPQTATWSLAQHRFGDFDLSVSAVASDGPIDNAFGVVFRAGDAANACDLPAVILCGLERLMPLAGAAFRQALAPADKSGYLAFLISSDGYYSLWQALDGADQASVSAWIAVGADQSAGTAARRKPTARPRARAHRIASSLMARQ